MTRPSEQGLAERFFNLKINGKCIGDMTGSELKSVADAMQRTDALRTRKRRPSWNEIMKLAAVSPTDEELRTAEAIFREVAEASSR
jgi:hypothetical protein